ncbi:helix-turn-helix domain-containing protein [Mammaliicoccus sciuri]|uniref:helix-turn-helix transcriptional regulator n=1 Tax=Mammaliicoccus sciuri TaxID=1296 RepID=UPI001C62BCE9|nr:helix-turn-helix transcriptional regulator [Mammaliicoccus sciuri]QYG31029.1 helix-turn-helix domain-containing protein [Mammaliicoccus sciuri]
MFSENLKYLRHKHNMEQIDLAHKLGRKSASSISEWEKGKYTPKLKVLSDIANLFNVNIDDLMTKDLSKGNEETYKPTTIAAHLDGEVSDLDEDEMKKVLEYVKFLKSQQGK